MKNILTLATAAAISLAATSCDGAADNPTNSAPAPQTNEPAPYYGDGSSTGATTGMDTTGATPMVDTAGGGTDQ